MRRRARRVAGWALLIMTGTAAAQEGGDLQAQILYAYHTEDANGLTSLAEHLAAQVASNPDDRSLRYHLAHADYRRGLLAAAAAPRDAEHALADCVDQLKAVLAQDVKSAEAMILQAACLESLADLRKVEGVLLRARADDRIKAALALEPRNPRGLFVASSRDLERTKPGTAEHRRAAAELELAAQAFDASSSTSPDAPGWGHADTYLALGAELEARGDRVGARNWIEKALIAAPDYKAAQRRLASLARP
jgi:hypothetical protein